MQWSIVYKMVDGKYELFKYSSNLVIMEEVDKVLPVDEHVARQANKLEYDGQTLGVKAGKRLMSLEELNAEQEAYDELMGGQIEPENETVKVEL